MWEAAFLVLLFVALWMRFSDGKSAGVMSRTPTLRQTGKCFREVVGESHYKPALKRIAGSQAIGKNGIDRTASLICENDNKFDSDAVRVEIDGDTVGYLSSGDALRYREALQRVGKGETTQYVGARIFGGGQKHYGVWLDLPDSL